MTGIDNDTHSSANINNLDACHSSSSSKTTPTVQEQPQPNRDEYERLFWCRQASRQTADYNPERAVVLLPLLQC